MEEINMIGKQVEMCGKIFYSKRNEDGTYNLKSKQKIYENDESDSKIAGTQTISMSNVTIEDDFYISIPDGQFKSKYVPIEKGGNNINGKNKILQSRN